MLYPPHSFSRALGCLLLALGVASSLLVVWQPRASNIAAPPAPIYLPLLQTASVPRLLFGLGPTASGARASALAGQAPLNMLTTWYNGPSDLGWMAGWRDDVIPQAYAAGYAQHVVVYVGGDEITIATSYGSACGRPYPLSDRFLGDMRQLAQIFAGAAAGPPLYVTLFSEFQTYPCKDNAWSPDAPTTAYYRALKDRYRQALAVFHQDAPNARVSLGWGGWQARWDDPATGAGRSLFQHFDDLLRASDFQSFQAMSSESNLADVRAMVARLGAYGPVMLAHYKPDNGSAATFERDLRAMLTDDYLAQVTRAGLFAWSFMDSTNLDSSPAMFQFTRDAIARYGR